MCSNKVAAILFNFLGVLPAMVVDFCFDHQYMHISQYIVFCRLFKKSQSVFCNVTPLCRLEYRLGLKKKRVLFKWFEPTKSRSLLTNNSEILCQLGCWYCSLSKKLFAPKNLSRKKWEIVLTSAEFRNLTRLKNM